MVVLTASAFSLAAPSAVAAQQFAQTQGLSASVAPHLFTAPSADPATNAPQTGHATPPAETERAPEKAGSPSPELRENTAPPAETGAAQHGSSTKSDDSTDPSGHARSDQPSKDDTADPNDEARPAQPSEKPWRDKAAELGEGLREHAGKLGADLRKGAEEVTAEIRKGTRAANEFAGDAWISAQVKTALVAEDTIRALDIFVSTNDGVVVLEGAVSTPQQRMLAEELVRNVSGVRGVVNRITFK